MDLSRARTLCVAVAAMTVCGCSTTLGALFGASVTEVEPRAMSHDLQLSSVPEGARVVRIEGDRRQELGVTPLQTALDYEDDVTLQRVGARTFWIGAATDVLLTFAGAEAAWSIAGDGNGSAQTIVPWSIFSVLCAVMVADVVYGAIRLTRDPVEISHEKRERWFRFALEKEGHPSITARIDVPLVGSRVELPLDGDKALALNHQGSPLEIELTKSATSSKL
jgi:hypothetical protein